MPGMTILEQTPADKETATNNSLKRVVRNPDSLAVKLVDTDTKLLRQMAPEVSLGGSPKEDQKSNQLFDISN